MGVDMVKITISGHPGSGTSTLVGRLEQLLNWSSLNGGQIFREQAQKEGVTLAEFGRMCVSNLEVDRELDEILQQKMLANNADIVESRLAGWWAYKLNLDCVRLWVNVSEVERAHRVTKREGISLDDALEANRKRLDVDLQRFDELYGLNPEDSTPYSHIIDASSLSIEDIVEQVLLILEEKQ
jgi:cytidylate kinase